MKNLSLINLYPQGTLATSLEFRNLLYKHYLTFFFHPTNCTHILLSAHRSYWPINICELLMTFALIFVGVQIRNASAATRMQLNGLFLHYYDFKTLNEASIF